MPRPKAKAPVLSDMERTLGVKTLSRIDPDEDFSEVDGDPSSNFALDGEASDRHYVWVRNHPDDIGEYKGGLLKYQVEHWEDGGVAPRMSADGTKGEIIQKQGHILMSCDLALWQKKNRLDFKKTSETNAQMFKRKQRDLDLRRPGALDAEQAEMR